MRDIVKFSKIMWLLIKLKFKADVLLVFATIVIFLGLLITVITLTSCVDSSGNIVATPSVQVVNGTFSANLSGLSHTQLTNIGTNNHTQVDSHISASSDIHGVSGSVVGTTGNQTVYFNKIYLQNGEAVYEKDTGGTYRFVFGLGGDNTLYFSNPVGAVTFQPFGSSTLTADNATISISKYLRLYDAFIHFAETTTPGTSANAVRVVATKGADNLTDLKAVFQDGTIDIFAQETTPLDAPVFTKPSGSIGSLVMIKPHPGLVQYVMQWPDGSRMILKEVEYHDADKIAANRGTESNKLPDGWLVTTEKERLLAEAK